MTMKNSILKNYWKNWPSVWLSGAVLAIGLYPLLASAQHPELTPELRSQLLDAISVNTDFIDHWDAQVWLTAKDTRMQEFVEDEQQRLHLLELIHNEAQHADLPTELVLAVIEVESRFDPYAVSVAGAQGLMQVMSFWKEELGRPTDNLTNIRTNLRYGCTILAYYHGMENGNIEAALARYNGSYGQNWYAERVMLALQKWR
jgi:soluble lytic murein transglycosylase-like protein